MTSFLFKITCLVVFTSVFYISCAADENPSSSEENSNEEGFGFSIWGKKISDAYDAAVAKGKEAYNATKHAVASAYDKIQEKARNKDTDDIEII